jgi:NADH pyrophosphatase NudC (nudix superfamily)
MNVKQILKDIESLQLRKNNLPNCEAVIMSNATLESDEWKEDPFLLMLLKHIEPIQLLIKTSEYVEYGKVIFWKPNLEMQLLLDEYRNLGKGRTIEFCRTCGFRMFSTKPTPRNKKLMCYSCREIRRRMIFPLLNPPSIYSTAIS